ncbi:MAG: efflux RND transporter periplasmic adaptor subunit [Rhodoferax sp.]|jgi:Cu(I)/Ag(I) efflux system membrane fusion protein|nr:efflux RND transporter periplasmic adaptor subunit [Rhodoferax sp.]
MKSATGWVIGAVLAALAGAGGYYAGTRGHGENITAPAGAPTAVQAEKKILYYRNPMGLADTSPTPKKDSMGMDYIAVYAGGADEEPLAADQVKISTDKVQKLGVRTEAAQLRNLDKLVRASGRIEPDERRVVAISPKFEGYVERLHVNVTGQAVGKGQALFEVYSPELVSAQREYAIAMQGVSALKDAGGQTQMGMQQLADASLARLRNWDISEAQIKALSESGATTRTLTFRSPVSGIVMEKKALQGMRFMPGEALYQIADLSSVWVIADVFEQDIGLVKNGSKATVNINAYPGKTFTGRVAYVYPTLNPETRTVPVRVELANPGGQLKPGMFAQVELPVGAKGQVVTVPVSAVIDSGTRQIVLIDKGAGRYESRQVKLGARSDTYVEVLDGVDDGEPVVVAANFLIDAESNLKAALGGLGNAAAPASAPAAPAAKTVGHQATGTVDGVDLKDGTVSLNHGPVASLKWPAMTMEFKTANATLLQGLKPGAKVTVEFIERQPGEWVITSVKP